MGIQVQELDEHGIGAIALIQFNQDNTITAVADPRKEGLAKVSRGVAYPKN